MGADLKKRFKELYDGFERNFKKLRISVKSLDFRGRLVEAGLFVRNSYFSSKNYFFEEMLGKGRFSAAARYYFLRGELPPEAKLKISQLGQDIINKNADYERRLELADLQRQREKKEMKVKHELKEEELGDEFDSHLLQRDEKIRQLEYKLSGQKTTLQQKTVQVSHLQELVRKLGNYILAYQARKLGEKGLDSSSFNLILLRDGKRIAARHPNRAAETSIGLRENYTQADFIEQNTAAFDRAFNILINFPTDYLEVKIVTKSGNQRKLTLEYAVEKGWGFLTRIEGATLFYRLYERREAG